MAEGRIAQRGQALVLFALLSTALFGALALVIDVGQLYMAQRRLQNAADMAALVGAQNRANDFTRELDGPSAVRDARAYAQKNGFATNPGVAEGIWHPDSNNGVVVYFPPRTGHYVGNTDYLEVRVAKTVPSLFATILGSNGVRLEARAVARGYSGFATAAIVALKEDPQALKTGGSANTYVQGGVYSRGGIYAHSSGGTMTIDGWAYARGTIAGTGITATGGLASGVPDISDPDWPVPPLTSSLTIGDWNSSLQSEDPAGSGWKRVRPGTYRSISVAPGDRVMFEHGTYYITKEVKIQGTAAGETNLPITSPYSNDNPPHGSPVSFVMFEETSFTVTAGAVAHFTSAPEYYNLIIRSASDRTNAVKIVGEGNVSLLGTVYAPLGEAYLAGSSGGTVVGQVVAGQVSLLGGTGPAVIYDSARVPPTRRSTLVE